MQDQSSKPRNMFKSQMLPMWCTPHLEAAWPPTAYYPECKASCRNYDGPGHHHIHRNIHYQNHHQRHHSLLVPIALAILALNSLGLFRSVSAVRLLWQQSAFRAQVPVDANAAIAMQQLQLPASGCGAACDSLFATLPGIIATANTPAAEMAAYPSNYVPAFMTAGTTPRFDSTGSLSALQSAPAAAAPVMLVMPAGAQAVDPTAGSQASATAVAGAASSAPVAPTNPALGSAGINVISSNPISISNPITIQNPNINRNMNGLGAQSSGGGKGRNVATDLMGAASALGNLLFGRRAN